MQSFFDDEESTAVWIWTPTHGAVDYPTAKEAFARIAQGVATGADIRLVAYLLKVQFKMAK